jgi:hypothetical protein
LDAFLAVKNLAVVALLPGLIGGAMFLFGAAYWAAPYGSGITVGQEDWSLLLTATGIVFSGVSASLLIRGQTRRTLLATSRLVVPLVPAGILLALATGWVATGSGFNPGGITSDKYGLPFTWKVEQYSCPPPCVQANGIIYNPLFFALDSLFFTLVCYVVLREYRSRTKTISRNPSPEQGSSNSRSMKHSSTESGVFLPGLP